VTAEAAPIRIETLRGEAIVPALADLARLRSTVFRAWPYLYEGDGGYESEYLRRYVESPHAAVVVARAGEAIVGAATCLPLAAEGAAVSAPFRARGWPLERFFYFGESVLLDAYRGRGIGVAFFAAREAVARGVAGIDFACFCGVVRPADHPARPADYVPLDAFWGKRGYAPCPGLLCTMAWRDVGESDGGESGESEKPLQFWARSLTGAALPTA
jgi:GNAT superfamily N-acetyltransferase